MTNHLESNNVLSKGIFENDNTLVVVQCSSILFELEQCSNLFSVMEILYLLLLLSLLLLLLLFVILLLKICIIILFIYLFIYYFYLAFWKLRHVAPDNIIT